jgi:hypothetical protein
MPRDAGTFLSLFAPFDQLGWIGIAALLGTYSGIYLFLRGFRMLQQKRLILNTPLSKIRSASMGLVEVNGMAKGPQTIRAGITGEPCYYYRARAWLKSESGNQGQWEQVADETVCVPFFVDDGTGRMLVYPQGAQLDVHRNFKEEYGGSFFSSRELIPESVRKFMMRHGISTSGTVRLEEQCILPGYPLFVFGTLGENPAKNPWPSASLTGTTPASPSFVPSAKTENVFAIAGLVDVPRAVPSKPTHMVPVQRGEAASHAAAANSVAHSPEGQNVHQVEAEEFDLRPRAAITNGEHNQLFTISSQSQRDVVSSLEWEAIGCIWGGPALALLSIYVLIGSWTRF